MILDDYALAQGPQSAFPKSQVKMLYSSLFQALFMENFPRSWVCLGLWNIKQFGLLETLW